MTFSLDYFTNPYSGYTNFQIALESVAALCGIASVLFAIRKNILVYPVGIISTSIYTYLLLQWALYGDMLINGYYTLMSIYGWWCWKYRSDSSASIRISDQRLMRKICILFLTSLFLVLLIYYWKYGSLATIPLINYIDSLYTAIFLVAMYLMAQKRIENWYLWFIGNALAAPVFFIKGYGITGIQYIVFLVFSIWGWNEWKKK